MNMDGSKEESSSRRAKSLKVKNAQKTTVNDENHIQDENLLEQSKALTVDNPDMIKEESKYQGNENTLTKGDDIEKQPDQDL